MSNRAIYHIGRIERILWIVFPPLAFICWAAGDYIDIVVERKASKA